MKYYLDTNIIIYAMKNSFPSIQEHFKKIPAQSIVIPSVVIAEIEYGARKSYNYDTTIRKYKAFTDCFEKIDFNADAAEYYGIMRAELERKGTTISQNDLMIAATVMTDQGMLVTHNTREFERIRGLLISDWTK